jgi:hypothetical protein
MLLLCFPLPSSLRWQRERKGGTWRGSLVIRRSQKPSHRPAAPAAAPATVKRGKDLGGQEAAQKLAEEASEIAACLSASPAVYPQWCPSVGCAPPPLFFV